MICIKPKGCQSVVAMIYVMLKVSQSDVTMKYEKLKVCQSVIAMIQLKNIFMRISSGNDLGKLILMIIRIRRLSARWAETYS